MVRSFIFAGRRKFITPPMFSMLIRRITTPTREMQPRKAMLCWMAVPMMSTSKLLTEHTIFALKPVVFLPFATHPIERLPRQSGFLVPNIGRSSIKGTVLGESVFWAINRSTDATVGTQYFSKRGWAPQGEFRTQPSETSFLDFNFY